VRTRGEMAWALLWCGVETDYREDHLCADIVVYLADSVCVIMTSHPSSLFYSLNGNSSVPHTSLRAEFYSLRRSIYLSYLGMKASSLLSFFTIATNS
jgi:hypothetical protein